MMNIEQVVFEVFGSAETARVYADLIKPLHDGWALTLEEGLAILIGIDYAANLLEDKGLMFAKKDITTRRLLIERAIRDLAEDIKWREIFYMNRLVRGGDSENIVARGVAEKLMSRFY